MNKFGKVFGCLMPMVLAFLCQFAVSLIGMAAYMFVIMFQAAGEEITDYEQLTEYALNRMMNGNVVMVIGGISVALTLLIGAFWYKKLRPAEHLSVKQVATGKLTGGMLLLGIALQLLISMCLNAVFAILPEQMMNDYAELMNSLIGGNVILSIIVTVILAPLAEEFLFRGVTLQKAQKIMPFVAANVLQALCFGIYHGNLIQGVYAFVLGLVFGRMVMKFRSVWAAVFLHACVNGAAQLLSVLPESVTASAFGVAGIVLAGIVFLFCSRTILQKAEAELPAPPEEEKFSENLFD